MSHPARKELRDKTERVKPTVISSIMPGRRDLRLDLGANRFDGLMAILRVGSSAVFLGSDAVKLVFIFDILCLVSGGFRVRGHGVQVLEASCLREGDHDAEEFSLVMAREGVDPGFHLDFP